MILFLFFNYWLILFNSCNYCTNVKPIAGLIITVGIPTKEAKEEMEMHQVTVEIKTSKCAI